MRVPPDHFTVDGRDHIRELEQVLLGSQAGVEHHLKQQVPEFLAEILGVSALTTLNWAGDPENAFLVPASYTNYGTSMAVLALMKSKEQKS